MKNNVFRTVDEISLPDLTTEAHESLYNKIGLHGSLKVQISAKYITEADPAVEGMSITYKESHGFIDAITWRFVGIPRAALTDECLERFEEKFIHARDDG